MVYFNVTAWYVFQIQTLVVGTFGINRIGALRHCFQSPTHKIHCQTHDMRWYIWLSQLDMNPSPSSKRESITDNQKSHKIDYHHKLMGVALTLVSTKPCPCCNKHRSMLRLVNYLWRYPSIFVYAVRWVQLDTSKTYDTYIYQMYFSLSLW